MDLEYLKRNKDELLNYRTDKGVWIAHNQEETFLLCKTPKDKYFMINDDGEPSISIHFNKDTSIILNEKGITIKAKQINLESNENSITINQAEFDKK